MDAYIAAGGYAAPGQEAVLERVELAQLRGRGGAGFPTAVKLRALREQDEGDRVVVANGEEGEPASLKDRYLCRARPHLVLDGLAHAAAVIGARRAYVYVADELAAARLEAALVERRPKVPTSVFRVEPSYVAGEESAVVRALDGGPAKPTMKPPRPFEAGVGGNPTLVQNVETLAVIALLASHGVEPHRSRGIAEAPGSFLLTMSGGGRSPRLYEVDFGVRLGDLVTHHLEGSGQVSAMIMGGFFGGVLRPEALELPLTYEALAAIGSGLGCGAIVLLGEGECPIAAATKVLDYLAEHNARQCGSCIKGTAAMRDAVDRLSLGRGDEDDLARLGRWADSLPGRGACATLDAAARMAASVLREFPAEIADHRAGHCRACRTRVGGGTTPFSVDTGPLVPPALFA